MKRNHIYCACHLLYLCDDDDDDEEKERQINNSNSNENSNGIVGETMKANEKKRETHKKK